MYDAYDAEIVGMIITSHGPLRHNIGCRVVRGLNLKINLSQSFPLISVAYGMKQIRYVFNQNV